MTIRIILLLAGSAALASGAHAGDPRLPKCTGPARYANPYGSVLPSLPIPGDSMPPAAPASPASGPPAVAPTPPGARTSPAAPTPRTGALLAHDPSC